MISGGIYPLFQTPYEIIYPSGQGDAGYWSEEANWDENSDQGEEGDWRRSDNSTKAQRAIEIKMMIVG